MKKALSCFVAALFASTSALAAMDTSLPSSEGESKVEFVDPIEIRAPACTASTEVEELRRISFEDGFDAFRARRAKLDCPIVIGPIERATWEECQAEPASTACVLPIDLDGTMRYWGIVKVPPERK